MSEQIRNPMQMSTNLFIDTVKQEYEAGQRYCFILGSGASYNPDDGIKSGEVMMAEWRNYLLNKGLNYIKECANTTEGGWDKCRQIFEDKNYKLKNDDYFTLYDLRFIGKPISGYNYLEKEMENKKPNVGYYYLSGILNNMAGNNLVITTNFDSLTEDAIFHCYGKHPLIIGHEKLASYVQNVTDKPIIAKIHRDLLLGPLNRSNELERLQGEWEENLRTVLSRYVPIVVGYAGGDQTLMQLLKKIKLKGIFWCELEGRDICDAAKEIVCNNNGFRVRIDGFDGLMYRLALAWGGHPDPENIKARYNEICEDYANKHEMFVEKYKNITFVVSSGEPPTPETVETARTVNKETNKTETEQDITFFDALMKYAENKYDEAIEILNELIIKESDNENYFFIRGNILYDLERYEEAIANYNKAIELKSDDAVAFYNKGNALYNLGRYEEALLDHNRAIEIYPDFSGFYSYRAKTLRALGRHEEAEADEGKAKELSKN